MIDLHAHLLPAIDDGPAEIDGALELARAAVDGGTTTMVCTPHVSWRYAHVTAALVAQRVASLREALTDAAIPLEVCPGAEVAGTRAVDLADGELRALRLGDGPWLMLECPLEPSAAGFERLAATLLGRGHRLVLAHPERSPTFQRDPDALGRLVARGALGQGTAGSFAGTFGRTAAASVVELLQRGLLHTVASDTHGAHGSRGPELRPVLLRAGLGEDHVDVLCRAVPAAVLEGAAIPAVPPWGPPRRRLLARLRR